MDIYVPTHNPILHKPAQAILPEDILNEVNQDCIKTMLKIAADENADTAMRGMVGLAAPQIGIDKRIILVTSGFDLEEREIDAMKCYINPVIISHGDEIEEGREGCFSIQNIVGLVPRYLTVTVEAFNEKGEAITETFTGFLARVMQHEVDHLNGCLFPERVKIEKNLHWVEDSEILRYREEKESRNQICTFEQWEAIKKGQL